jgi:hypothetical protein
MLNLDESGQNFPEPGWASASLDANSRVLVVPTPGNGAFAATAEWLSAVHPQQWFLEAGYWPLSSFAHFSQPESGAWPDERGTVK